VWKRGSALPVKRPQDFGRKRRLQLGQKNPDRLRHRKKVILDKDVKYPPRKGKALKLRRMKDQDEELRFKRDAVVKDQDENFYRIVKIEMKYRHCYVCVPTRKPDDEDEKKVEETDKRKAIYFEPESLLKPLERVEKKQSRVMYSDTIVLACEAENDVNKKREEGLRAALLEKMKPRKQTKEINTEVVARTLFPSGQDKIAEKYNYNVLNRLCKEPPKEKSPTPEPWEEDGTTRVVLDRSTLPKSCPW